METQVIIPAPSVGSPAKRPLKKGLIAMRKDKVESIYGPELLAAIARRVDLVRPDPVPREELEKNPDILRDVEVIFSGWGAPLMDETFLNAAPKLQAVFYGAGSIRYFTTEAFWDRNILVTSAYAMGAVPVAEYTLATILLSLKNVWHYALGIKRRGANMVPWHTPCAGGYGSTVGLISLGMIGRLVLERLRLFEIEVLAYDPFVTPDEADTLGVELVSLDDIFRCCDVVSLHTPWLKETENMIQGRHFELMKKRATFINTARGAIVDEPAMLDVLARRSDLTAVLDVTYPEPPVDGSPIYTLPNVVLTPHIAGAMDNECRRMGLSMIEEFDRWAGGEPMKWAINREKAARLA